ncbi:restriction endonuclease subunit S [Sorangium sp. So ce341]|uniref:restriction endonuclease subunit S n=1 Tax=Sorangium sp. So ce341 TaxID=3133302 RepID=UPI003F5F2D94
MSELPDGWARAKLNELAAPVRNGLTIGPFGSNLKVSDYRDEGVPLIFVRDIRSELFGGPRTRYVTPDKARELESHMSRPGDLLITKMGDPPGDTAVHPAWYPPAVITADCIKMTPGSMTSATFLKHWLRCGTVRERILEETKGVAQQKLSLERFRNIDIEIPPSGEQSRIVAKIETLTSKSRRAKEALDAIPALLERFRKSVLAAAFRGDLTADWREKNPDVEPADELLKRIRAERRRRWEEAELAKMRAKGKVPGDDRWKHRYEEPEPVNASELPELPEGWCWAPAAGVVAGDADIMYGIIQPGPVVADGVPYVRGMDIEDGKILEHQLLRTHPDIAARYARASLEGGDVLLGIIRATKVAIVPSSLRGANITQGTARFRPASGILTEYLAGWLESPWAQDWLHSKYRGIDMPGLNLRDVRLLPVPIAPAEEQRAIAEILKSKRRRQASLGPLISSLLQSVTEIDAAILAKAFRGELVPQDANDEPASVLLERLRAEAAQNSRTANGASRGPKAAAREPSKSNSSANGRRVGARPR